MTDTTWHVPVYPGQIRLMHTTHVPWVLLVTISKNMTLNAEGSLQQYSHALVCRLNLIPHARRDSNA